MAHTIPYLDRLGQAAAAGWEERLHAMAISIRATIKANCGELARHPVLEQMTALGRQHRGVQWQARTSSTAGRPAQPQLLDLLQRLLDP